MSFSLYLSEFFCVKSKRVGKESVKIWIKSLIEFSKILSEF